MEPLNDANLYQRLLACIAACSRIKKDKPQGMRYEVVLHDTVNEAVRPLLLKYGIVMIPSEVEYVQDGQRTQVKLTVQMINVDKPEERETLQMIGFGVDGQDKGPGKAISYAWKYLLMKMMGMRTGEDSDMTSNEKLTKDLRASVEQQVVTPQSRSQ